MPRNTFAMSTGNPRHTKSHKTTTTILTNQKTNDMKKHLHLLGILLLTCVMGACSDDDKQSYDSEQLEGRWQLESVSPEDMEDAFATMCGLTNTRDLYRGYVEYNSDGTWREVKSGYRILFGQGTWTVSGDKLNLIAIEEDLSLPMSYNIRELTDDNLVLTTASYHNVPLSEAITLTYKRY